MAQSSQRPPENDDELPPLNIGVAATIKAKKTSFEAFAKAVADPEFQEQLDNAVLNPEGDDARRSSNGFSNSRDCPPVEFPGAKEKEQRK